MDEAVRKHLPQGAPRPRRTRGVARSPHANPVCELPPRDALIEDQPRERVLYVGRRGGEFVREDQPAARHGGVRARGQRVCVLARGEEGTRPHRRWGGEVAPILDGHRDGTNLRVSALRGAEHLDGNAEALREGAGGARLGNAHAPDEVQGQPHPHDAGAVRDTGGEVRDAEQLHALLHGQGGREDAVHDGGGRGTHGL